MNLVYYFFFIVNTVIGVNIFYTYGLNTSLFNNFLLGVACILILRKCSLYRSFPIYKFSILLLLLGHLIILFFTLQPNLSTTIIAPLFIISAFPNFKKKIWTRLLFLYLAFFTVECSLAIVERILQHNFFEWMPIADKEISIEDTSANEFRSTGLLGHPLQNALVVSFSMSFILLSDLKMNTKMALWGLGFISILCFNTRSSMVGNAMCFVVYVIKTFFYDKNIKKGDRLLLLSMSVIMVFGALFCFFSLGLGARLMEMGLFDENSSQVRLDIWSLFDYASILDFMFGIPEDQFLLLLSKAGLWTTENFWFDFLFMFGFVYLIIAIYSYFLLFKFLYKWNSKFYKFFTLGTFLLIASTNNSLTTSWHLLAIFLIALSVFNRKKLLLHHGK